MNSAEETQAVIDALQLEQLALLQHMVIAFMIAWALFFIWLTVYFLRRMRSETPELWRAIGSPTLWRKNGALLKFIMSQQVKQLPERLQAIARLLRYMTILGATLAIAVIFALLRLYWI